MRKRKGGTRVKLSAKFARRQIERFRSLFVGSSLENARRGQSLFGEIIQDLSPKLIQQRYFYERISFCFNDGFSAKIRRPPGS